MTTNLHGPLARYAARLHGSVGDRHHVASPLGAWLLLALGGSTGPDRDADGLADALGTDPATAARTAAALLDAPHPLVPAATAVWHRPDADTDALAAWRGTLPRATQTGPLPDQAGLDAWARRHSAGLLDRFPLTRSSRVVLALASAVATRISWADPFDLAPATALGPDSPWAGRLTRVLRTPGYGHRAWIAATPEAGDVAVHAAAAGPGAGTAGPGAGAGLLVVSVAAAPGVAPADVLAAAYRIAADADADEPAGRRSLFDLPLGATPLWTLREETVRTHARDGRQERHTAALPCWSARDEHDLAGPGLGFPALARVLAPLVGGTEVEARQAVVARYSRYGFEAAAVTAAFAAVSLPPEGVARTAELRFGHPYAVVAVATDRRGGGVGPWHGVPVFSGWVAEPDDVAEGELADPPVA
ncbi:hypothetical protein OOK41_21620 [Micromonospora sp. NBC_01655]|uniref:hypothetical protein n=1 Tax=Micromonospora sp. NBC_01655 TaxID=2975983 RepID=UPI00224E2DA5|nr:hypothetical protein [Micromonospora sp. NBC_01655]MCX4472878.1 hypothetical protein [Micromonospora sp. NBC_01655]